MLNKIFYKNKPTVWLLIVLKGGKTLGSGGLEPLEVHSWEEMIDGTILKAEYWSVCQEWWSCMVIFRGTMMFLMTAVHIRMRCSEGLGPPRIHKWPLALNHTWWLLSKWEMDHFFPFCKRKKQSIFVVFALLWSVYLYTDDFSSPKEDQALVPWVPEVVFPKMVRSSCCGVPGNLDL